MPPSSRPSAIAAVDRLVVSLITSGEPLRIFGYGSIIWQPNFRFASRLVGSVAGFKRRFYQGSTRHRGTDELPGRVATLVPKEGATVYGIAFEIVGVDAIRAALTHLTEREVQLGGYSFHRVSFQPLQQQTSLEAFAYIAGPENPQYLGKASLELQARQVAMSIGPCGANLDYVRGVAEFMLGEVPDCETRDRHLFRLLRRADDFANELKTSKMLTSSSRTEAVSIVAAF